MSLSDYSISPTDPLFFKILSCSLLPASCCFGVGGLMSSAFFLRNLLTDLVPLLIALCPAGVFKSASAVLLIPVIIGPTIILSLVI